MSKGKTHFLKMTRKLLKRLLLFLCFFSFLLLD